MNTSERASYSRNIQFPSSRELVELAGTTAVLARELEESPFVQPAESDLTLVNTYLPSSTASMSFRAQKSGERSAARIGITEPQDGAASLYTHDQALDVWRAQVAHAPNTTRWHSNGDMLNVLAPHLPESVNPLLDINPDGNLVQSIVIDALANRTRHLSSRVAYKQHDYLLGSTYVEQTGTSLDFLGESSSLLEVVRDRENVDRITRTLGAAAIFNTTEGEIRRTYRFMSEHSDGELTAIESDVTFTSDSAQLDRLAALAEHETPERLILQLSRSVELLEQLRNPTVMRP